MADRPKRILLLRHAEKPDEDSDPNLSTRGFTRAAALSVSIPAMFGRPAFIVATKTTEKSARPVQTVTPLASTLRLEVHDSHKDEEFQAVADALLSHEKFRDEQVVVCWHHGKLPQLAKALGVVDPPSWEDDVFDRFWLIEFDGEEAKLAEQPQRLLFGDG
jgi:hypothetical protein